MKHAHKINIYRLKRKMVKIYKRKKMSFILRAHFFVQKNFVVIES